MFMCGFPHIGAMIAGLVICPVFAGAQQLAMPVGDVMLTVSGEITQTNADDTAQFDRAMLASYPVTQFTTSTVWTQGEARFAGVALAQILEIVGAQGTAVVATAVDEFSATIPLDTITDTMPILAYAMDGKALSLRDNGPIWIMYPYDSDELLHTEIIHARSVPHLVRLDVVE